MDNLFAVIAFSIPLLLVSGLLMLSHASAWRKHQRVELDEAEFNFWRRQCRRRMQTSAMIGILGVGIAAGYLLTLWFKSDLCFLLFMGAALLLICWILLLALVDVWATRHYFGRLRDKSLLEQTKLHAELRQLDAGKNGGQKKK